MRRAAMLVLAAVLAAGSASPQRVLPVAGAAERAAQRFEALRGARAIWTDTAGDTPRAAELALAIADAASDGLDPADYPLPGPAAPGGAAARRARERAFTRALLAFAGDLANGRVNPASADTLWRRGTPPVDVVPLLATALDSQSVARALALVRPPSPEYAALREALARYRAAALRGWPAIPPGPTLRPGARDPAVVLLRRRLAAEGYAVDTTPADTFDLALAAGLARFQAAHGLAPDSALGTATRAALGVSPARRAAAIALNLERLRWNRGTAAPIALEVDVPAFELTVRENGREVLTLRTIVGTRDWPTPIAAARVVGATFRPKWYIPASIAVKEVVPLARRNPAVLRRLRIRVFRDSVEIDPDSVDWRALPDSGRSLRFVEDACPANPLGRVKLTVASPFNVHVHDTPNGRTFERLMRAASHGCVRVQHADSLVALLLDGATGWTAAAVRAAMADTTVAERWVPLAPAVPIAFVYRTARVAADGVVEFRPDVYRWDARLAAALARTRRR